MKFYINKIVLWIGSNKRELQFFNNKVNIITGEQSKGKSTIIEILDFCFFASENPIVQGDDYINFVDWFAINFFINNKHFTIGRNSKKIDEYYFSSSGEIPQTLYSNAKESSIQNAINTEFSINDNVVFPYGGKDIKKGTRISPRYFLLFCTQRRNTLSNDEVLFDKQSAKYSRYQEALSRIFDIAIGSTTIDNMIKRESLLEKELEKDKLEKKQKSVGEQANIFESEIKQICSRAKSMNIVPLETSEYRCIALLKQQISNLSVIDDIANFSEIDALEEKKIGLQLQINKYKKYINQYDKYKQSLNNDLDSLMPISYLNQHLEEILNLSSTHTLFSSIESEMRLIREYIFNKKSPAIIDLHDRITKLEEEVKTIDSTLANFSEDANQTNITNKNRFLFLGEIAYALKFYENHDSIVEDYSNQINKIQQDIDALRREIKEIDRSDALLTINEFMQNIFDEVDFELSGYAGYKPTFDFKSKMVFLKKRDKEVKYTKEDIVKNIGSSSNHLFLHLAFFTAIHRLFIQEHIPYIPPFLILDQPDSPYYENNNSFERATFLKALRTLDKQISYVNDNLNHDFQIIVLEHIEWKEIEEAKFENFVLVDQEWRNGYGLVPPEILI